MASEAEARAYLEALQAEAAHTAPSPEGAPPPPPPPPAPNGYPSGGYTSPYAYASGAVAAGERAREYAITHAPAPAQPILGQLRPYLLPTIVGGATYYLTESKLWTAGLALATLLLQGSHQPAAPAPPPGPAVGYYGR